MVRLNRKNEIKTKKQKNEIIALAIFLAVAVIAIVAVMVLVKDPDGKAVKKTSGGEVFKIGGVKCTPKNNVDTYLLMGIDGKGKMADIIESEDACQADVIVLLVIDREANTFATINIDRDTITDVDSLDSKGNYLATTPVQLALAYSHGDGGELSCENISKAVSNLFFGQQIDGYAAIGMDAIARINHEVGGVTVTIEDDFKDSDKSLKMGQTIKLSDKQAQHYLHDRMNVGDGTNVARMRRHNMYLQEFKKIVKAKAASNKKYPIQLYHSLDEYTVSSLTSNDISKISKAVFKNKELGQFKFKGTYAIDDYGFNAFTYDKKDLEQLAIKLFYDKVEK